MSRELRAKQREVLKLARPFFDKSLVRSFSSFEILAIGTVVSGGDPSDLEHEPVPSWLLCIRRLAETYTRVRNLDLLV